MRLRDVDSGMRGRTWRAGAGIDPAVLCPGEALAGGELAWRWVGGNW